MINIVGTTNLLKSTNEGELDIGGIKLNVAVLEDGRRVISQSSVFRAFGRTKRGRAISEIRVPNRPPFIDANNLQPYIGDDLEEVLTKIEYFTLVGTKIESFDANILPLLCKLYLDAREQKSLVKSQLPLARASEILLLSLSKIGITALVDEATGYQKQKDEYQKTIALYIAEEIRPWLKTFKDDYYEQLYKLLAWDWETFKKNRKNHPQVLGKITNELVYYKLPNGVLQELEKLNPKNEKGTRKVKHHQLLTESVGYRHLIEHLAKVTLIASMYGRGQYHQAKVHIDSLLPDQRQGAQLTFDMPLNIDEYIGNQGKEEINVLSDFNQKLKKGLDFNPSKKQQ